MNLKLSMTFFFRNIFERSKIAVSRQMTFIDKKSLKKLFRIISNCQGVLL